MHSYLLNLTYLHKYVYTTIDSMVAACALPHQRSCFCEWGKAGCATSWVYSVFRWLARKHERRWKHVNTKQKKGRGIGVRKRETLEERTENGSSAPMHIDSPTQYHRLTSSRSSSLLFLYMLPSSSTSQSVYVCLRSPWYHWTDCEAQQPRFLTHGSCSSIWQAKKREKKHEPSASRDSSEGGLLEYLSS